MPFQDYSDGQTHYYGDGCKPAHRTTKELKLEESFKKDFDNFVKSVHPSIVDGIVDWWLFQMRENK